MRRAPKVGNCAYCGRHGYLTRDHIIPRALLLAPLGGRNIILACKSCNALKVALTPTQMHSQAAEMLSVARRLARIAHRTNELMRQRGLSVPFHKVAD